jgi:hypothetical protein
VQPAAASVGAIATERIYLSGTGPDDAVEWEFRVDGGRESGDWGRIPVPSQWELEGFGELAYGQDDAVRAEIGTYRTRFAVPAAWRDRRVRLVFEGAMTDLEAVLNGRSVGVRHRGGFTEFSYDVTGLLRFDGSDNVLTVEVFEASDEPSVNSAEREADYWVFGGIYRPVFLEALPSPGIDHVAVDARHDGSVRIEVEVSGDRGAFDLGARVLDRDGEILASLQDVGRVPGSTARALSVVVAGILPWSAEHPELYEIEVDLIVAGTISHRVRRRFGFRTVEVRGGRGLFINSRRVLLKGINRHSLWPESGRALTRTRNRRDAEMIKDLNANAVRASHYPPDAAFLEACDEIGLYVIDELPGWHDAYRRDVGRRLVKEMVRRDVNHPSVILWANGNEGGWNVLVESEFRRHDPQRRRVIHPGDDWAGLDTVHYPSWEDLQAKLAHRSSTPGQRETKRFPSLVMPTEMLHGLYDGGLGAGLAEYWRLIRASPRAVGAFLWSFVDEGILRVDRDGGIDTHGAYGPDGIVDPYRAEEGSFATVRSIWSPAALAREPVVDEAGVRLEIENRFDETDLAACRFRWRWLRWPTPGSEEDVVVVARGERGGLRAGPAETGVLDVNVVPDANALEVVMEDPYGRDVWTETITVIERAEMVERALEEVDLSTGVPIGRPSAVAELGVDEIGFLGGDLQGESWRRYADGWIRLQIETGTDAMAGEEPGGLYLGNLVPPGVSIEWLGRGPTPVWRNRRAGPAFGYWSRVPAAGFYDDVVWARIASRGRQLTVVLESGGTFLGFSAPEFPKDASFARAVVPPRRSLSFLWAIPPIGTKFHAARDLGSSSTPAPAPISPIVVWLRTEAAASSSEAR